MSNFLGSYLAFVQISIFTLLIGHVFTFLFLNRISSNIIVFVFLSSYLNIFAIFFWLFCALFAMGICYFTFFFINSAALFLAFFFTYLREK